MKTVEEYRDFATRCMAATEAEAVPELVKRLRTAGKIIDRWLDKHEGDVTAEDETLNKLIVLVKDLSEQLAFQLDGAKVVLTAEEYGELVGDYGKTIADEYIGKIDVRFIRHMITRDAAAAEK